jgi:hypothetical protein
VLAERASKIAALPLVSGPPEPKSDNGFEGRLSGIKA